MFLVFFLSLFFVLPSGVHLKKEANKFERKVKWLLKSYLHDFRVRASFVRVRCAWGGAPLLGTAWALEFCRWMSTSPRLAGQWRRWLLLAGTARKAAGHADDGRKRLCRLSRCSRQRWQVTWLPMTSVWKRSRRVAPRPPLTDSHWRQLKGRSHKADTVDYVPSSCCSFQVFEKNVWVCNVSKNVCTCVCGWTSACLRTCVEVQGTCNYWMSTLHLWVCKS